MGSGTEMSLTTQPPTPGLGFFICKWNHKHGMCLPQGSAHRRCPSSTHWFNNGDSDDPPASSSWWLGSSAEVPPAAPGPADSCLLTGPTPEGGNRMFVEEWLPAASLFHPDLATAQTVVQGRAGVLPAPLNGRSVLHAQEGITWLKRRAPRVSPSPPFPLGRQQGAAPPPAALGSSPSVL